jgi:hypothetical protein
MAIEVDQVAPCNKVLLIVKSSKKIERRISLIFYTDLTEDKSLFNGEK